MLKRIAALLVSILLLTACSGKSRTADAYAVSHGGPLTVRVTVDDSGRITDAALMEFSDTPAIGGAAAETIIERVRAAGSARVDGVSGATVTSMALLSALEEAAAAAGAKGDAAAPISAVPGDIKCDVLVIGGGGAGLTAALAAAREGAKVVLCERMSILGGSTARSDGYFSASTDSARETIRALKELGVTMIFYSEDGSYAALDPKTGLLGGGALIKPLADSLALAGGTVLTDTKAVNLTTNSAGAVTGAVLKYINNTYTCAAAAVVICTGGDAAAGLAAQTGSVMVMASAGDDGSGTAMARRIGASCTEALPLIAALEQRDSSAGILVDGSGRRFCNEAAGVNAQAAALIKKGMFQCYYITDRPLSGAAISADSVQQLEEALKMDSLAACVERYNGFCFAREDADFGKQPDCLTAITGEKYYAEKLPVIVYGTVGGLAVDESCAVLSENGGAIQGLYAAGEAANASLLGSTARGDSLSQVFLSGRTAGAAAAEYAASLKVGSAEQ